MSRQKKAIMGPLAQKYTKDRFILQYQEANSQVVKKE